MGCAKVLVDATPALERLHQPSNSYVGYVDNTAMRVFTPHAGAKQFIMICFEVGVMIAMNELDISRTKNRGRVVLQRLLCLNISEQNDRSRCVFGHGINHMPKVAMNIAKQENLFRARR